MNGKAIVQVDFKNISTESNEEDTPVKNLIKNFEEASESLPENIGVHILKSEIESRDAEMGRVSVEIELDLATIDEDDEDDDTETDDTEDSKKEAVSDYLADHLDSICEEDEIEYSIADISIE